MTNSAQFNPNEWIIDQDRHSALSIQVKQCLFSEKSPYQTVEIYETYDRGKMLTLDRIIMCTEKDEAAYHEMLVHVPLLSNPQIEDVLVIGGGDGGTVRELVRHEQIKQITMVEIDELVIRASQEFLPTIASAFNHPKLNLLVGDGIEFVRQAKDDSYDLILLDSSDPIGPAEGLFTESFYQNVYRCLRSSGITTVQSESPAFNTKIFQEINQCLQGIFGADKVYPYLAFTPMYPGGIWSFTYCTKEQTPSLVNFKHQIAEQFTQEHHLRYYNADIHQAAFCLPTYIQQMIGN